MNRVPVISVVIPSYNSVQTIRKCLDSVINQSINLPYEIIVVDSSEDETPEILETYAPRVRYYHFSQKTIPAIARNIGIDHAAGEYIAFTDSDCIVDGSWLREIMQAHQSGYDVVCGSIINARPSNLISIAEYFLEFREFSVHSPKRESGFIPAGNFSIRASLMKRSGKFPDIRTSEDTFLAYNLLQQGKKILFEPRIKIQHINRNQLKPMLRNQYLLGMNSALIRRVLPLPGASLIKHPATALVIPLIRFFKTIQIISRNHFPYDWYDYLNLLLSFPFYIIGIVAFSVGFRRGVCEPLIEGAEYMTGKKDSSSSVVESVFI
ncbi:MAG: glycosyltransferase [Desulfosalsimonadaceae bacterium]